MPDEVERAGQWPLMVALFAINVFWGASFVANTLALRMVNAVDIAALRFFIATPLLVVATYLWKGKEILKFDPRDLGTIIVMSLTGVTLQYIIQVRAQDYTTATNASLLINISVFVIIFLSALFLNEKLSRWRIVGSVIGFLGVAVLVTNGSLAFDLGGHVLGDIMILVCAFLWSIYSIFGKKIATKYHPLTVLNYMFIVGTICLVPFYLFMPHTPVGEIPMAAFGLIVFLAIFCSIIAYLVYNVALEKMSAARVGLYIYFVPISTIVLAWLILGDVISWATIGGGLMVLLGMYIAEIRR